MIRVLIADDSPDIRDGLSSLMGAQSDFFVVGIAGDGLEAVEKAKDLQPDVVIMDAQMPRMDGIDATRKIKRDFPAIRILFLSTFTDYADDRRELLILSRFERRRYSEIAQLLDCSVGAV